MDKQETNLLKLSGKHSLDTGDKNFKYVAKNTDDLVSLIYAGQFLAREGFIENLSDNFYDDSFRIPQDLVFEFAITNKGFAYYLDNLEDKS